MKTEAICANGVDLSLAGNCDYAPNGIDYAELVKLAEDDLIALIKIESAVHGLRVTKFAGQEYAIGWPRLLGGEQVLTWRPLSLSGFVELGFPMDSFKCLAILRVYVLASGELVLD